MLATFFKHQVKPNELGLVLEFGDIAGLERT
jgi:hypothetical protein